MKNEVEKRTRKRSRKVSKKCEKNTPRGDSKTSKTKQNAERGVDFRKMHISARWTKQFEKKTPNMTPKQHPNETKCFQKRTQKKHTKDTQRTQENRNAGHAKETEDPRTWDPMDSIKVSWVLERWVLNPINESKLLKIMQKPTKNNQNPSKSIKIH